MNPGFLTKLAMESMSKTTSIACENKQQLPKTKVFPKLPSKKLIHKKRRLGGTSSVCSSKCRLLTLIHEHLPNSRFSKCCLINILCLTKKVWVMMWIVVVNRKNENFSEWEHDMLDSIFSKYGTFFETGEDNEKTNSENESKEQQHVSELKFSRLHKKLCKLTREIIRKRCEGCLANLVHSLGLHKQSEEFGPDLTTNLCLAPPRRSPSDPLTAFFDVAIPTSRISIIPSDFNRENIFFFDDENFFDFSRHHVVFNLSCKLIETCVNFIMRSRKSLMRRIYFLQSCNCRNLEIAKFIRQIVFVRKVLDYFLTPDLINFAFSYCISKTDESCNVLNDFIAVLPFRINRNTYINLLSSSLTVSNLTVLRALCSQSVFSALTEFVPPEKVAWDNCESLPRMINLKNFNDLPGEGDDRDILKLSSTELFYAISRSGYQVKTECFILFYNIFKNHHHDGVFGSLLAAHFVCVNQMKLVSFLLKQFLEDPNYEQSMSFFSIARGNFSQYDFSVFLNSHSNVQKLFSKTKESSHLNQNMPSTISTSQVQTDLKTDDFDCREHEDDDDGSSVGSDCSNCSRKYSFGKILCKSCSSFDNHDSSSSQFDCSTCRSSKSQQRSSSPIDFYDEDDDDDDDIRDVSFENVGDFDGDCGNVEFNMKLFSDLRLKIKSLYRLNNFTDEEAKEELILKHPDFNTRDFVQV